MNNHIKFVLIAMALSGCNSSDSEPQSVNNVAPVVSDLSLITETETAINDQLVATDADNDTLSYHLVTGASNGMVELTSNGHFIYTPKFEFTGADRFEFQVSDGVTPAVVGVVRVEVEAQVVSFAHYSRSAFTQVETDMPLSVNGRAFIQDATSETEYDDLLGQ